MNVDGKTYRSIWAAEDDRTVCIIDQTKLPYEFSIEELKSLEDAAVAIKDMLVRGAPLIGATGAYGMALAMREDSSNTNIELAHDRLISTRPTASNLSWALKQMTTTLRAQTVSKREETAYELASVICENDVKSCHQIGRNGAEIISNLWHEKGKPERLNVLTHCNAGWLATVDWGTALAAIYVAHDHGVPVHVWVDETRPRNQGAGLTAWELGKHGVAHTLIVDNAGGHLMQHGQVDMCIVGTDRTTATGDVCNKVGTYLKALAAQANEVPFYVALPHSTIDWEISDGIQEIPIEIREPTEVTEMRGVNAAGRVETIRITPEETNALNVAFDVTPARYITGLITERGVCEASKTGLLSLYPERTK